MDAKEWYQDREKQVINDTVSYGTSKRLFNSPHVNNVCKELFEFINNQNQPQHDITVFCDYDADGIASGKVAVECLLLAGMDVNKVHIVPDDRVKGFGFNKLYANELLNQYPNTGMIITTDNGTASWPEAEDLAVNGIKLIITDHHPQSQELYNNMHTNYFDYNFNLVNPKEYDSQYSFQGLSGTGTIWKLFQKYFYLEYQRVGVTTEFEKKMDKFRNLIPYVCLSIISDQMVMKDENRAFVESGFNMINNDKAGLLWELFRNKFGKKNYGENQSKIDERIIGWNIAPVLNADSRIHLNPYIGLFLFLPKKRQELIEKNPKLKKVLEPYIDDNVISYNTTNNVLDFMIDNNQLRKNMISDIMEYLQNNSSLADSYVIELNDSMLSQKTIDNYHQATQRKNITLSSIAGIIAGHISNQYHRPSIVVAEEKDSIHKDEHPDSIMYLGSSRSESFDLLQLNNLSTSIKITGHDHAAGASIITNNLPEVINFLNKEIDKIPQTTFDNGNYLSPNNINIKMLNKINNLGPFGQGFSQPLFRFIIKLENNNLYYLNRFTTQAGKTHLKIKKNNSDTEVMIWNIDKNQRVTKMLDEYEEYHTPFQISFVTPMTVAEYNNHQFCQAAVNSLRIHSKRLP